jgi:uncharacterized membrane protein HdeD (DUF308 family)
MLVMGWILEPQTCAFLKVVHYMVMVEPPNAAITSASDYHLADFYMLKELKQTAESMWWLLVLSSIASILFGIATLFMPGMTLFVLVVLFASFLIAQGILELVYGFSSITSDKMWWMPGLVGAVLLGSGIYLAEHPAINLAVFVIMIGGILVLRGVYDIMIGIFFATSRTLWFVAGILSVLAGVIIWIYPVSGGLAFVWVLGLYALLDGAVVLGSAISARAAFEKSGLRAAVKAA